MPEEQYIRTLIQRDEIDSAIGLMQANASADLKNVLIVIASRHEKWKKDKRLGLGPNITERNAIVNDLVDLLRQMENGVPKQGAQGSTPGYVSPHSSTDSDLEPARPQIETSPEKRWFEKISVLVPVIVAVISGLFLIWQTYLAKDKKDTTGATVSYELIFIDQQTLRPPNFITPEAKIRIYDKVPPEILPIVLGTVKFDGPVTLTNQPVIIEFEGSPDYKIVDRVHLLKPGKNEVFVNRPVLPRRSSCLDTKIPLSPATGLPTDL